jgi:hypothetical protein
MISSDRPTLVSRSLTWMALSNHKPTEKKVLTLPVKRPKVETLQTAHSLHIPRAVRDGQTTGPTAPTLRGLRLQSKPWVTLTEISRRRLRFLRRLNPTRMKARLDRPTKSRSCQHRRTYAHAPRARLLVPQLNSLVPQLLTPPYVFLRSTCYSFSSLFFNFFILVVWIG